MSVDSALSGDFIGISPELTAHAVADDRLLLLGEERSFSLSGRLYVELANAMNGWRVSKQIIADLSDTYEPELINTAIAYLLKRGYVRHLAPEAPTARQAMWVELGMNPADTEAHLAETRFHVIASGETPEASGEIAAERLSSVLEGSGLRCEASAATSNISVVLVDDYLSGNLHDIGAKIIRNGGQWLPLKAAGKKLWIGPVIGPDTTSCLTCMQRSMAGNRPGDHYLSDQGHGIRPAGSYTEASLLLAFGFAGMELARLAAGEKAMHRSILTYDIGERRVETHAVRNHHDCADCGAQRPTEIHEIEEAARIRFTGSEFAPTSSGWRAKSAEDVLRQLKPLVSPITGIVPDLMDISASPDMPVYAAVQFIAGRVDPRQNRTIGKPNGAAGKGATKEEAQVSCLAEAVERYSCGHTGAEPSRRAKLEDLGDTACHPHHLLNYSPTQYENRLQLNEDCDSFAWVAEPFNENNAIEWTPAWSHKHDKVRWLPTRYCYFNYSDPALDANETQNAFCRADSNGCASGAILEEAVLQGALELVERDSVALWWYNRIARPAFDLDSLNDPLVEKTRTHLHRQGRNLHVLDLTSDIGIPVCAAVSANADGERIVLGLGAHPDAAIAARRAVAEHNQMAIYEPVGGPADMGKTGAKWLREASLQTQSYLMPSGTIALPDFVAPPADLATAAESCLKSIARVADDVIILDTSRSELNFSCARIVAPGLRHFWPRFAAGRLYDGPVKSGWTTHKLNEAELNPIHFFL